MCTIALDMIVTLRVKLVEAYLLWICNLCALFRLSLAECYRTRLTVERDLPQYWVANLGPAP